MSFLFSAHTSPGSARSQAGQLSIEFSLIKFTLGFRSDRNARIVVCQDGDTLPAAARAEIGTGLCHVYLSLHTVHRPGLQLGVCMANYEPYVHLHIHLCCQVFCIFKI